MFKVRIFNSISAAGLARFPQTDYDVSENHLDPDALILRSYDLHAETFGPALKAVGRAGVGVNNIPIEVMSQRGIPVFNAPGANANAVKELFIAGMLLAARNICPAWDYVRQLDFSAADVEAKVEQAKHQFAGFELPGRTLGVIGLGAIGVLVSKAALGLGMRVIGYDPQITVRSAWQLDASVEQATSVSDLLSRSDVVTLHVPYNDKTHGLLNENNFGRMQQGATLINFSRGGIVDTAALKSALDAGRLHAYVSDFPSAELGVHPRIIALPHIGASTQEAQDNSAVMVANQICDFLEAGNIVNSVNFPEVRLAPMGGYRIALVNANVPNMVGQISTRLAEAGLNIIEMLNRSRGEYAYTLIDVETRPSAELISTLSAIQGVITVRPLTLSTANGQ